MNLSFDEVSTQNEFSGSVNDMIDKMVSQTIRSVGRLLNEVESTSHSMANQQQAEMRDVELGTQTFDKICPFILD